MSARLASLLFLASSLLAGFATEKTFWRLGEPDRSDHEFASGNIPHSAKGLVIRMGSGNEAKLWPRFHPGSGNTDQTDPNPFVTPYAYGFHDGRIAINE